ncbi:hypothetical protein [Hydrocarboniclastica marina]|uniref:hypothetical protein n=1 Tax=Hydrocarboniclastica marina TaxID=2259620 RepID=UPI0010A75845|nr:hypothetical protein [Hydrocarboniclastica marina]
MKLPLKGLFLIACAAPLHADDFSPSWRWNAFASQGAIHTSDNNFFGRSDDSVSTEFRELGLLLGAEPLQDLQLSAQFLSREAGEVDETDFQVDYAFATYDFYAGVDALFGIKAGRIRAPVGFYNETRDVAHTRPSILLPQSVYPERLRDLTFSRDGVQLFGSYQFGLSSLNLDLSYAELNISGDDYPELVGIDSLPGEVETPYAPMARLIYDWDLGRARLGVTYADFSATYKPIPGQELDISFDYWVLSAEYNAARWSLIAEYSTFDSNLEDIGNLNALLGGSMPMDPAALEGYGGLSGYDSADLAELGALAGGNLRYSTKGFGYYIQGVYRITPAWDAFLRWDVTYSDEEDRDNPFLYTKDVTTGVGWRLDSNWLMRAEWHVIEGNSILSTRENRPQDLKKYWQMVLFQISYRI